MLLAAATPPALADHAGGHQRPQGPAKQQFSIAAHSLGVTLARKTLQLHPELRPDLRPDLVAFVAIAGANHGTSFCPEGSQGQLNSCDEIAASTPWLAALNGPDGNDETYPPARWLTVYDGSGAADPAFAGSPYAQSPRLLGADNREFPGSYHNDLRLDPVIVRQYREFIEAAETAETAAVHEPTTGGTLASGFLLTAVLGGWRRRRRDVSSPPLLMPGR